MILIAYPPADLAQKPIRSQSAVIRDRDGRPCSEFVRSRNPVTVIITILTGDPCLGAAPSNEWKWTDLPDANPIDRCGGSSRAAFVAMMQPTDLGKRDNLAR
jgi:hypothetical protein